MALTLSDPQFRQFTQNDADRGQYFLTFDAGRYIQHACVFKKVKAGFDFVGKSAFLANFFKEPTRHIRSEKHIQKRELEPVRMMARKPV